MDVKVGDRFVVGEELSNHALPLRTGAIIEITSLPTKEQYRYQHKFIKLVSNEPPEGREGWLISPSMFGMLRKVEDEEERKGE